MKNNLTSVKEYDLSGAPSRTRSYSYSSEATHLLRGGAGNITIFRCPCCQRNLPESQFFPVGQKVIRGVPATVLHPLCNVCRKQSRGQWTADPLYTPELDRFFSKLTASARGGASARGILFAIEKDDLLGLYLKQGGLCAISGLRLKIGDKGRAGRGNKAKLAPSVDRINSHGNYVLGNVQIVAGVVNVMKNDLAADVFIELCRKIAGHNVSL